MQIHGVSFCLVSFFVIIASLRMPRKSRKEHFNEEKAMAAIESCDYSEFKDASQV